MGAFIFRLNLGGFERLRPGGEEEGVKRLRLGSRGGGGKARSLGHYERVYLIKAETKLIHINYGKKC